MLCDILFVRAQCISLPLSQLSVSQTPPKLIRTVDLRFVFSDILTSGTSVGVVLVGRGKMKHLLVDLEE